MCRDIHAAWLTVLILAGCRRDTPPPPAPPPPEPAKVKLVAVGDILMHADVKAAATLHGGFEPLWEEAATLFRGADLAFAYLETPIAPAAGQPGRPFLFNAPPDLPQSLSRSGFTVLATANNHAYDQGAPGLVETLERLESAGLAYVGSGKDRRRAEEPRILERNGIRIAFLAWTDLLNRGGNQAGGPWVNRLRADRACLAVRAARSQADVVVVSVHWGTEDQHDPTPRQRQVASRLFEAGADLILGHHPHVLQPLEAGEAGGRRVAVAYSLGNFISNQDRMYDAERMEPAQGDARDGAALVATFVRKAPDEVVLDTVGYTPLWTENNWRQVEAGGAEPREIRVVRLDLSGRQIQPWSRRRERIREILGGGFELRVP